MIQPLTVANDLIAEINRVLTCAHRYLSPDDLAFRRYLAEANKLLKAKPAEGHNLLGLLHGLTGDYKSAAYHADIAISLSPGDPVFVINKASMLANLGFFSESQKYFKLAAAPEQGIFSGKWQLGVCAGAFHALSEFIVKAQRMQLPLEDINVSLIKQVAQFMDDISLDDARLAAAFDIAGDLLRQQKLFFLGPCPEVFVWDKDAIEKHLTFIYAVGLPAQDAIALDEALGQRLLDAQSGLPFEIMIHFESGLPLNERFAERAAVAG